MHVCLERKTRSRTIVICNREALSSSLFMYEGVCLKRKFGSTKEKKKAVHQFLFRESSRKILHSHMERQLSARVLIGELVSAREPHKNRLFVPRACLDYARMVFSLPSMSSKAQRKRFRNQRLSHGLILLLHRILS